MSAATSSRSPATWSRKRSGSSASAAATKVRAGAEEAAMERLLDALTGKGSSEATRAELPPALRRRQPRPGRGRDRGRRAPAMPFEIPGMGAQVASTCKSMMGKAMGQRPRKRRKLKVPEAFARLTEEEADKRARSRRHQPRRAGGRRGERHRLPRRDRQDRGQRRARRLGQPRGRPARPAAADRRHHGRDQIRAAEDRPYPVHRLAARSTSPSPPTCCPSCRAACRSGSS